MIPYETLAGRNIVLEPLDASHTPSLIRAALVGQSMFERLRTVHLHTEQEVRDWVIESVNTARDSEGECLPYTVIDVDTGSAVGSTWYVAIDEHHRRCELRWTWLAAPLSGISVNLEAKLLMLDHAIANGIERAEFRVDPYDSRARRLLERLGARLEGQLRDDYVDREGIRHDTCIYAMLAENWEQQRGRVVSRLGGEITEAERERALAALQRLHEQRNNPQSIELPLPRV